MRAPLEPTLALAQARARWGDGVVMAGLFRPGPDPTARTALTKAVTRRSNRRQGLLPARVMLAIDDEGRALACPVTADPQGGHPSGADLYAGPFEELGAVTAGELSIVVLLDDERAVVLEALWLDRDAATVAAFLTGEPLPEELGGDSDGGDGGDGGGGGGGGGDDDADDDEPSPEALLAEADAFQARANSLRAIAAMRREGDEDRGPTTGH